MTTNIPLIEVIIEVLRKYQRPLTIQEIHEAIISSQLYNFESTNSEDIVQSQVNLHTNKVNSPSTSSSKYFEQLSDNTYTLLSNPAPSIKGKTHNRTQRSIFTDLSDSDNTLIEGYSYPALPITQNKHRFYFSTIPVADLFPSCFVARRNEDPIAGFQRTLSETRANDIANYLASGLGSIPTNIVLSAQSAADLRYNSRSKTISYNRVKNAFLVLDGQHRLWGYHKCSVTHRVPVAIYVNLSRSEEARLFVDINTNQRGVSAALLLDIKQIANLENNDEQLLRTLFDRLQQDPHSPLVGKLSAAKSAPGKISRISFNRSLQPLIASGVLSNVDQETKYKLILNYLNAFDAELDDKSYLTRSAYFEAIFDLLDEVVNNSLAIYNNVKQESLQNTIQPLAKINLFATMGTSITKKGILDSMKAILRRSLPLSDDLL